MNQDNNCASCGQPIECGMHSVEVRLYSSGRFLGNEIRLQQGTTVQLHQLCFQTMPQKEILWLPFKRKP